MTELQTESFPIDALTPYHRNPRRGNVTKIAESLKARGQYKPIVVNKGSKTGIPNEILAGNHTWQAAKSLGWTTIQAVTVDLDADQAAQIVVADNRLADLGGYDAAALAEVLSGIEAPTVGTGYEADDIAEIIAAAKPSPAELKDPDDVPATPRKPFTQAGQIWKLGDSLLVVGSSTDEQLVTKAVGMIGQPSCIWTDPPYGVAYKGATKDHLTIQNDADPGQAVDITRQAFQIATRICKPGCPFYMAHSDSLRVQFQQAIESVGLRWRQTLIWVKDTFTLGHSDYQQQTEPIAAGTLPDKPLDEYEPIGYGFTAGGRTAWPRRQTLARRQQAVDRAPVPQTKSQQGASHDETR
ncbi:DNA modification methylase [Bifidobacterium sp. 82T10]|uniref:DNA modification methylase n=1 Tax=Bifidobacterium miconis TaxID=2834435 RepID=A0ABS6WGE8_9BIFI|nr:ParB N-terminal domain-containing protein [Bifidobacterium miconis]MBW3092659.1 DNA modification methylase [Bifidobacterium miconis]